MIEMAIKEEKENFEKEKRDKKQKPALDKLDQLIKGKYEKGNSGQLTEKDKAKSMIRLN